MSDLLGLVKPLGRYMCLMKHESGFALAVLQTVQNKVQTKSEALNLEAAELGVC